MSRSKAKRRHMWEHPENNGCTHDFQHTGTSGNVYEGGCVWSRCTKCKVWRSHSEDGASYYPPSYKPYYRTLADDLRDAHVDPHDDLAVEYFLGRSW
jgi:hypothetical protein